MTWLPLALADMARVPLSDAELEGVPDDSVRGGQVVAQPLEQTDVAVSEVR